MVQDIRPRWAPSEELHVSQKHKGRYKLVINSAPSPDSLSNKNLTMVRIKVFEWWCFEEP